MRAALPVALLIAVGLVHTDGPGFTISALAKELGPKIRQSRDLAADSIPKELGGRAKDIDGDTLRVGGTKVRLCGIDSAEVSTPAGREARRFMHELVDGRTVRCRVVGTGTPCDGRSRPTSYDRIVAQCFIAGRDLAATAVRLGIAKDWPLYSGGFYSR